MNEAEGDWHTLPPRARLLFHLQALSRVVLFWGPVTLVGGAALAAAWSPMGAFATAAAWLGLQLLLALIWPGLAWARWAWVIRRHDLLIARGVLVKRITAIPSQRIQHVDTRQGPIEQWLGLARVQIYTASGMGADGSIPGLDKDTAEALRDRLMDVQGDDGV